MGAVASLGVIVMGHIQALVHIVEAEGHLGGNVQIFGSYSCVNLMDIQLRQHRCDFCLVQKVQASQI